MSIPGPGIEAYRDVAPRGAVDFLLHLSERVRGRHFVHVNSTRVGGGVAEILRRLVPLMNDVGVKADWEIIEGDRDFFAVTKAFHNALQGEEQVFTEAMLEHYLASNRTNASRLSLNGDLVLIHDPQPAALVESRPADGQWVWRCHIDLASPQRRTWSFLRRFVLRYDAAIFSLPAFAQQLAIPQFLVYPSIDPLADKNRELEPSEIEALLSPLGIPRERPVVLQVSRFDRFKDPIGVINAYRMVKPYHDCVLVLAGGGADDDPEGERVLAAAREAAARDSDIHVLDLPPDAHLTINALQRTATIILQKSTKEGFGLTVSEAMWKGKPVIGGATGGITTQILPGVTGYTVSSVEGCAYWVRHLLAHPDAAARMGAAGREHVRQNFLITRHLREYISLMARLVS